MDNSETTNTNTSKSVETSPVSISSESNKWLKIVLLGVVGLALVGGLVYAGFKVGQREAEIKVSQPTSTSTFSVTLTPIPKISPTLVATSSPELTLTPDQTADWKTYTNTIYGYEIKYPSEFSYKISEKGEAMVVFDPSQEVLESPAAEDKTLVIITADTSKPVIDKSYYGEPAQIAEEVEVTVDGEIGQQVVFSKPVAWIQTAVPYGKRSFYFNLQNMQYRSEYNQILSTFKFLE